MRLPRINRAEYEKLSPEEKKDFDSLLAELERIYEEDPLQSFEPLSDRQREFLEAKTPVQAAFAGNRFGKTTVLVAKCLIQHRTPRLLPENLRQYRQAQDHQPVLGRLLVPSEKAFEEYTKPAFQKWCPKDMFRGGSWDKAWDGKFNVLHFSGGQGKLGIYTYKQDPATMVGAALDYVAYDEPPPEAVRRECLIRLADAGERGFEAFALTPVNMQGSGIGWLYRTVWKRREADDVTVIQGSIYDNPLLDRKTIDRILKEYPEDERRARELGEFVHFGGMVYPGGFEQVLVDPPSIDSLRGCDVLVGLDPGLKNAAFVWVAIDRDDRAVVFDEVLLQERTPQDYVDAIRATNLRWGLKEEPMYVIDPSARNRSLVNAESVEAELARLGVYSVHGQNDVQAGVQQVRTRLHHKRLFVSRECRGLRSESEEYRMEDRPDGEFKVVKENDHRLDALRYALMARPWFPAHDERPAEQTLGWTPGRCPPQSWFGGEREVAPMGSMS